MGAIPIIDIFAGPGGLGEGFSAYQPGGRANFKIALSIEKDFYAHRTLELRAFFRQFASGNVPHEYYEYLRGKITRQELFSQFAKEAAAAQMEAWHAELGSPAFPNCEIDRRISSALGKREKWVLIGGPPCQAYSLAGRSRLIGGVGLAEYEKDPRHKLYEHYLRILAVHRPPVFVMENVKGLLSAKVREEHMFERILKDLQHPSAAMPCPKGTDVRYRLFPLASRKRDLLDEWQPEDFVVRAEEHGVPQARHRVIILGVRTDLNRFPTALDTADPVTVSEAIGDLPSLRSGLSKVIDSREAWRNAVRSIEASEWMLDGEIDSSLKVAMKRWVDRLGKKLERGGEFISYEPLPKAHFEWFWDQHLQGVCNHQARTHMREDLHRYFFAAVFTRERGRAPLLDEFPRALLPKHENVNGASFRDRFRVQLASKPSSTIVSHIAKDGHYFIHYDPSQCRSLTVREAARLQTFPDNYFFEGPRTEQYKQVGNAVPPFLARQIANTVADLLQ